MAIVYLNKNFAACNIALSTASGATSIAVPDGSIFPATTGGLKFKGVLFAPTYGSATEAANSSNKAEIVDCTRTAGSNTITIARGKEGTTDQTHSAGAFFIVSATAGKWDEIESEIALKSPSASPTFTGTVVLPATTSIGTTSAAEIGYLVGVTSAIQTQINAINSTLSGVAVLAAGSNTFTGNLYVNGSVIDLGNNTTADTVTVNAVLDVNGAATMETLTVNSTSTFTGVPTFNGIPVAPNGIKYGTSGAYNVPIKLGTLGSQSGAPFAGDWWIVTINGNNYRVGLYPV